VIGTAMFYAPGLGRQGAARPEAGLAGGPYGRPRRRLPLLLRSVRRRGRDGGLSHGDRSAAAAVEPSSAAHHEIAAEQIKTVALAIVTVSDSRTEATDTNHHYLRDAIAAAGHEVVAYRLIKDEPDQVGGVLDELVVTDARLILFNGGTGIAPPRHDLRRPRPDDREADARLRRALPDAQLGPGRRRRDAIRATAGVYRGKLVSLPPARTRPSGWPGTS
jgi:molybdenum cofactor biosynthesis protein B